MLNVSRVLFVSIIVVSCSGCVTDALYALAQRPSVYPAQVLTRNGEACFSVEDVNETRKNPPEIGGIVVTLHHENSSEMVWTRGFPSETGLFHLSPSQCILYGDAVPAPVLEYGEKYSVYINASINGDHRPYKAYFCMTKNFDGKTEAHEINWNDEKAEYDWSVCGKDFTAN